MSTAGDRDRLEHLELQIEQTRSDVAGIAGTLNGLTDLVLELGRRTPTPSDSHQAERWQARLGSLDTRLEMLETNIRSEVDRLRASAGTVDALADDFRSTVGGTRNLVELASDISERVGVLHSLESGVR